MIPVIDYKQDQLQDKIREAYTTVGFAVFSNALNTSEQTTMDKWFVLMKKFFDLDIERNFDILEFGIVKTIRVED